MTETAPTPIVCKTLMEIAEVIGPAAALRLAEVAGGQDGIYVPHTPRPDHPWAAVLGPQVWADLCAAWGGGRISIPRNAMARSAKARMAGLKKQDLPHRAIARELGVTERYVRMVLNAGVDRQGDLFGQD